jgi:hypothetical protein
MGEGNFPHPAPPSTPAYLPSRRPRPRGRAEASGALTCLPYAGAAAAQQRAQERLGETLRPPPGREERGGTEGVNIERKGAGSREWLGGRVEDGEEGRRERGRGTRRLRQGEGGTDRDRDRQLLRIVPSTTCATLARPVAVSPLLCPFRVTVRIAPLGPTRTVVMPVWRQAVCLTRGQHARERAHCHAHVRGRASTTRALLTHSHRTLTHTHTHIRARAGLGLGGGGVGAGLLRALPGQARRPSRRPLLF